jgi:nickel superoxide dismutase
MRNLVSAAVVAILISASLPAGAHCQMPCGIYADEMRVQMIEEDLTTIEKAMQQIVALGKESPVNYNQLVRWVNTKEEHAQKIQELVSDYFLAQRIKAPAEVEGEPFATYTRQLVILHSMLVEAMKCKQTVDLSHVESLRVLVKELRAAYFGPEQGHTHPEGQAH